MVAMSQATLPYSEHRVVTSDGVELAAQSIGAGSTILIANGMGLTRPSLDMLVEHLRHDHRVITWDYRGAGDSFLDRPSLEGQTMARHAQDGLEVLRAMGEEQAVIMGWSMGVPVCLEMIRAAADRVVGFGALFGSAGPVFRAAFPRPFSDLIELNFRAWRYFPLPGHGLMRLSSRVPAAGWGLAAITGFVGDRARRDLFHAIIDTVDRADKRIYMTTMKNLMAHDARDVLPSIRCPTLIVAGDNDWVTPPSAAQLMKDQVAHAQLCILADTSHFGPIEHGPELWGPIDELCAAAREWRSAA
jgi:3-oxoadipate enol-lactonase